MIVKKKLSVRDTERKVNEIVRSKNKNHAAGTKPDAGVHLRAFEDDLKRIYGTMVKVIGSESNGSIQFTYATRDDLMRLADKLKSLPAEVTSVKPPPEGGAERDY